MEREAEKTLLSVLESGRWEKSPRVCGHPRLQNLRAVLGFRNKVNTLMTHGIFFVYDTSVFKSVFVPQSKMKVPLL